MLTTVFITNHAVTRFIERAGAQFGTKPREEARAELTQSLVGAVPVKGARSPNDNEVWKLCGHNLFAIVEKSKTCRKVLTVLTAEMANMAPRTGPNTKDAPSLTAPQIAAQIEMAQEECAAAEESQKALQVALRQKHPPGIPPEYWEACVEICKSGENRNVLLQRILTESAAKREKEKTLRHQQSADGAERVAHRNQQIRAVLEDAFRANSLMEAYEAIANSAACASLVDGIPKPRKPKNEPQSPVALPPVPSAPSTIAAFPSEITIRLVIDASNLKKVGHEGKAINLRQIRQALGLNQTALAAKLGVPRTSYIRYEATNGAPEDIIETLKRYAQKMGIAIT